MHNQLNIFTKEKTISSLEVAEMVEKEHKNLMRDVRNYVSELNQLKIEPVDFFRESTYKDGKGEERPCYAITKKGCEFIAHKLTGKPILNILELCSFQIRKVQAEDLQNYFY